MITMIPTKRPGKHHIKRLQPRIRRKHQNPVFGRDVFPGQPINLAVDILRYRMDEDRVQLFANIISALSTVSAATSAATVDSRPFSSHLIKRIAFLCVSSRRVILVRRSMTSNARTVAAYVGPGKLLNVLASSRAGSLPQGGPGVPLWERACSRRPLPPGGTH
jgi:hypothetical protein